MEYRERAACFPQCLKCGNRIKGGTQVLSMNRNLLHIKYDLDEYLTAYYEGWFYGNMK